MIDLSLGEFSALVAKALRGTGYSWGLAEDGAYAARELARFGLHAPELVVDLLREVGACQLSLLMPSKDGQSPGSLLCPVCVGAVLADASCVEERSFPLVAAPLLVAPLIALTLSPNDAGGFRISWTNGECDITRTELNVHGSLPTDPTSIVVQRVSELRLSSSATVDRVHMSDSTMDELTRLAHRTYAPATEASRAGAGARSSDND